MILLIQNRGQKSKKNPISLDILSGHEGRLLAVFRANDVVRRTPLMKGKNGCEASVVDNRPRESREYNRYKVERTDVLQMCGYHVGGAARSTLGFGDLHIDYDDNEDGADAQEEGDDEAILRVRTRRWTCAALAFSKQ